jgi:hypothetical protein
MIKDKDFHELYTSNNSVKMNVLNIFLKKLNEK